VKLGGVGALHAAFLNESRTRGCVQRSVQEIRVGRSFSAQVRSGEPGAPVLFLWLCLSPEKLRVEVRGIPHLAKNERDARISCTLLQPSSACAAFIKESRMKFGDLTKPHRKSGVWGTRRSWSG
jgi:hypothetical protein